MVIFGDGGIITMFRYKVSGFSVERQSESQIGDSCENSEFVNIIGGRPPPPFKYCFSIPTKDSVPVLVSVYATDHYKTILTVVVKNSTRGPGGWFGIY